MENILNSMLLEYEKSTFLLDLMAHHSGTYYIRIKQHIESKAGFNQLQINLSVLTDLISVLQSFQKMVTQSASITGKSFFSDERQSLVLQRYFKGVTIEDLTLQFDCSKQIIEQILFNKDAVIVDNRKPKRTKRLRLHNRK